MAGEGQRQGLQAGYRLPEGMQRLCMQPVVVLTAGWWQEADKVLFELAMQYVDGEGVDRDVHKGGRLLLKGDVDRVQGVEGSGNRIHFVPMKTYRSR